MPDNVAIDNDFFVKLTEIKRHNDVNDLIRRFFQALDVLPHMHPLVMKNEWQAHSNTVGNRLFAEDVVHQLPLTKQFDEKPALKSYYEQIIREIYHDFTGEEAYPCGDIFTEWKAQKSLGEIHTVAACILLQWDCFLSDDKEAGKRLPKIVANRAGGNIQVCSRAGACDTLRGKSAEERCGLTASGLNLLSHK